MSRASQLEQENDQQFHLLANKISTFKDIANEINGYAQEDSATLNTMSGTMTRLSDEIKHGAHKQRRVVNSNPKMTRMVAIGVGAFIVLYITFNHFV